MLEFIRRLMVVSLLAASLPADAQSGYLSVVGPPPLRFETPSIPSTNPVIVLPPLAVLDPRPEPSTNSATTAAEPTPATIQESNIATNSPAGELQVAPSPKDAVLPSPVTGPQPENGLVVPQMLLKYFTGRAGTNSPGVSLYSPVGFVPPVPLVPPSSSATFQTTPPAKP